MHKWKVLFIAIFNSFIILGLFLLSYIHIISSGLYRKCVYKTQPNAETQHQHCDMVRGIYNIFFCKYTDICAWKTIRIQKQHLTCYSCH